MKFKEEAIHRLDLIHKDTGKFDPWQVKLLFEEYNLDLYSDFDFICSYCLEGSSDFVQDINGTVHIFGGLYRIEDNILGMSWVMDLDELVGEEYHLTDMHHVLCDYSDFPNILYSRSSKNMVCNRLKNEGLWDGTANAYIRRLLDEKREEC